MAFEHLHAGAQALTVDEFEILETATAVRPYAATFAFMNLVGCQLEIMWAADFDGGLGGPVWASDPITVNPTDARTAGLLTPIVPAARGVQLVAHLISGTPTGDLVWDLFAL